ncbi:hypothetical protein RBH26_19220 [Natronolimnohabitans sp. A-GB9]|uniref:hypothetical protein n=1 Tax=Natronolimnohabitans sp. A-GB9 TaxID=3069757 RepID=UPI0027B0E96E|nr:hypothetical protein [Natronolimnohabitans sp. A-GB9]MDQ2052594.1 hypothetical protein [Natronolimnohabitans sp. A-GB9]
MSPRDGGFGPFDTGSSRSDTSIRCFDPRDRRLRVSALALPVILDATVGFVTRVRKSESVRKYH